MKSALVIALISVPFVAGAEAPKAAAAPAVAAETAPGEALPFIEDDYPRALAEARSRKLPLFVDTWAPWCHTCRFMRAYVFSDAALAKQAGRYVWLSVDTEKERNAPFLAKYPVEVWPTLMVVDPTHEQAVLRWPGSANVSQLVKLLDDGERAAHGAGAGSGGGTQGGLGELVRADRLNAEGKKKEAAVAYRTALAQVPPDKRPRTIESLLGALALSGDSAGCAQAAVELVPTMPRGPSFANATGFGLGCAAELKGEERGRALKVLEPLGSESVALPGLLADDRSGLYETLVELREQSGDVAGKKALAGKWLAFLEGEAARAPTPEQRAAFDPHRVNAALALGEPLRVVVALQLSERDLPKDYNPPARLALIYRAAGRFDDALAAIDRALGKVYGPRALRFYDLKADVQLKKGDRAAAKQTLEKGLQVARALPPEQQRAQLVGMMEKRIKSLP